MKKYSFVKMSGAGNDFVIIDLKSNPPININLETVKRVCDRRNGIGADGLITISDAPGYDFKMNYYNSDGSISLCGNGARCAIKFSKLFKNVHSDNIKFLSNETEYSGNIKDGVVKFNLNAPFDYRPDITLQTSIGNIKASFINTGSPHVIVNIEENSMADINIFPVLALGREIRYLAEFAPGGANVNFIKTEKDKVVIRTYERGVEDETLACGTGSVAAAVICSLKYGVKTPVNLLTKGGKILMVDFIQNGQNIKALSLSGPAEVTFMGEFSEEMIF